MSIKASLPLDWFGCDIDVHEDSETETTLVGTVKVVKNAMHYWLLQYCESVQAIDVSEKFAEKLIATAKTIYNISSMTKIGRNKVSLFLHFGMYEPHRTIGYFIIKI